MRITGDAYRRMIAYCQAMRPHEGCGILSGPVEEPDLVDRLDGLTNVAEHPRQRYEMDPTRQLALWEALDEGGYRPRVVFHSHPVGRPYPSPTDVRYATDPALLHVIVALDDHGDVEVRLWRMGAAVGWGAYRPVDLDIVEIEAHPEAPI